MASQNQPTRLTGVGAQDKCPQLLRQVEAVREDTGEMLVFLTHHHGLGASTMAAIYKERWQVELFFKALKQNLKIKTFVGTSANAVKIQIWTALISMLLLGYLQLISRFGWSWWRSCASISLLTGICTLGSTSHSPPRPIRKRNPRPHSPSPDLGQHQGHPLEIPS